MRLSPWDYAKRLQHFSQNFVTASAAKKRDFYSNPLTTKKNVNVKTEFLCEYVSQLWQ
jgi:hypothetical protein